MEQNSSLNRLILGLYFLMLSYDTLRVTNFYYLTLVGKFFVMDHSNQKEKITEKTNPVPLHKSTKEILIEVAIYKDRPHIWVMRKLAERLEREWSEGKRTDEELF